MKAIQIHQYGGPEVLTLEEVPIKKPGPTEARVRLKMIGVNFIDIYFRKGIYREGATLPFIDGLEGSGIVEEVGSDVKNVKPGDRVAYADQPSSYAEENIVEADRLILLPKEFSFEQGAAFPLQGMTAHYLLHEFRKVKPGVIVLIHAAAGGMGQLLVQWARHLGAVVIGTVSTEEKEKTAYAVGAHHVINYTKQNFASETLRITEGHGADLILDGVGKTTFARNLEASAIGSYIVIYGSASGSPDPIDPSLLKPKSLSIAGPTLWSYIQTREELLRRSDAVIGGILEGWLQLKIDRILPLAKAHEAHRILESRQNIGKILLTTE